MPFTAEQIRAMKDRLPPEPVVSNVLIAVVFETVKAINTLRGLHGLAPFTKSQVLNAIKTTAANLADEDD